MFDQSSVKIGRNDPCPCGSGKKYKKCCLAQQTVSDDSPAARVCAAQNRLLKELTDYIPNRFRESFMEAWADYNFAYGEDDDLPEPDEDHQLTFMSYFLFHWDPDAPDSCANLAEGGIVARTFLQERAGRLDDLERQVLETLMRRPFNFYEIVSCPPDEDFSVRDLWTDEEIAVSKLSGAEDMLAGEILYAQLLSILGVTTIAFTSLLFIPGVMKESILNYREILREDLEGGPRGLTLDDAREQQDDLRELYLEILDTRDEAPPIVNEDGDPLEPHIVTYEVESTQAAFDALSPLARGVPKQQMLKYAGYDADGRLAELELPWTRKGHSIFKKSGGKVLGTIRLSGRTLLAEVNSENRAARVKKEIERCLGAAAVYKETVKQSLEEALEAEEGETEQDVQDMKAEVEHNPELRDAVRDVLQEQVNGWPNHKVPALGNKTPLQAVKDPKARKIVESLIADYEHTLRQNFPPGIRPDLSVVRRLLDL